MALRNYQSLLFKTVVAAFYAAVLLLVLYLPVFWQYVAEDNSLNICTFTETFHPDALRKFEELHNVKINMTYVENDDELFAKFQINGGEGYDVVNLSDYMVKVLADADHLAPYDHQKLGILPKLDQRLLNHPYDKENAFSVPHKWFVYGVLYNTKLIPALYTDFSYAFVFENPADLTKKGLVRKPYKVCLLESANDMFFLGLLYRNKSVTSFTNSDALDVKKMLIAQKRWVECYTFNTIEYFMLSGAAQAAITASNFARKVMSQSEDYTFAVPKEGGILVIENLCIPKRSSKKDLAEKFIDFMLSDDMARCNAESFEWTSANPRVNDALVNDAKVASHLIPDQETFKRLHIPLFTDEQRKKAEDAWLEVGFA